jgi:hypothetical protein
MTILPVDHHSGHKVGPIVFILGKNIAKCKDIGNSKWPPRGFFQHICLFINIVTTEQVIVFILSEHAAMYDNMPYG